MSSWTAPYKTEICLFHKNDQTKFFINFDGIRIESSKEMNVLGVTFDSKLNWSSHTARAITKAKKALYALRLLKKFFTKDQMRTLLDSYFYSVLYYNSIIWLSPELNYQLKQSLLSISANALRSCMLYNCSEISFIRIHEMCKKCTPSQIMLYQILLRLHKFINETYNQCTNEHALVMINVICTSRQLKFEIIRNNRVKIGMNTTLNKFYHINKLISLDNLNLGYVHFKKLMKFQFLKNGKT